MGAPDARALGERMERPEIGGLPKQEQTGRVEVCAGRGSSATQLLGGSFLCRSARLERSLERFGCGLELRILGGRTEQREHHRGFVVACRSKQHP
jgi:hypothetical protein